MLVDRKKEIKALQDAAKAGGGQLVIVWGRRRVGKTYLLQAFSEKRRTIYYAATQQSAPVELTGFTEAVKLTLGADRLPPGYYFPNWAEALDFVTENAGNRRTVVVLDEFPYLASSSPGLESVIQRWWDQKGRRGSVMLVLCGSAVSYMEQVAGGGAPLHQRATVSLHVRPLDYRAAGQFVRGLAPADRAVVFGVLGGTPLYLEQWDPGETLQHNLTRLFGRSASPLVDAAELVLSGEVPELEGAFRILQAVAIGRTRAGDIGNYAKVAVERPIKRLVTLGMLERRVPALEDPARTKRANYRISDPYFAFWFRFIAPNRAHIARGLGPQLVETRILPGLNDYMGGVFEEMAREHARLLAAADKLQADSIHSWWSGDGSHEIDLVGLSGKRVTLVGSAKWSARPLGSSATSNLEIHASSLPAVDADALRLLYGRAGCSQQVTRSKVLCFSVSDLYGPLRLVRKRR